MIRFISIVILKTKILSFLKSTAYISSSAKLRNLKQRKHWRFNQEGDEGVTQIVDNVATEEDRSQTIGSTSVRRIAASVLLSWFTRFFERFYCLYKLSLVQQLIPDDMNSQHFSLRFLARVELQEEWNILWTDEATFI
ncbi:hypothetical protein TNCV_3868471 [Trichonephila clavipes]|nr:hypothetical protein TNCV_3868471 [Trichonephila clavipes]